MDISSLLNGSRRKTGERRVRLYCHQNNINQYRNRSSFETETDRQTESQTWGEVAVYTVIALTCVHVLCYVYIVGLHLDMNELSITRTREKMDYYSWGCNFFANKIDAETVRNIIFSKIPSNFYKTSLSLSEVCHFQSGPSRSIEPEKLHILISMDC